jgi:hypothetical protein
MTCAEFVGKFHNDNTATIGDLYGPAMVVRSEAEASDMFEALVARRMHLYGKTEVEACDIEKGNIAYYAGYHSEETRVRVYKLFKCLHPLFGGNPAPDSVAIKKAVDETVKTGNPVLFEQPGEDDFEVECINIDGIEDKFDAGVTYVAYSHLDPEMIWVVDRFGKSDAYFKGRFKQVIGEATCKK